MKNPLSRFKFLPKLMINYCFKSLDIRHYQNLELNSSWTIFFLLKLCYIFLIQIYFGMPEIFKTNIFNQLLNTKSPFFVLWIHKGYFVVKSWCEMFVLKLFGIQNIHLFNPKFGFPSYNRSVLLCMKSKEGTFNEFMKG